MNVNRLKHAYLIIAHGNFEILKRQITFLDSDNTDIYIHVDKKAGSINTAEFISLAKKSKVYFIPRISVNWGAYSMAECELALLRYSVPFHYDYYHLISGVDVPIKSKEYIDSFFESHNGTNFINFQNKDIQKTHLERVMYYYPLQDVYISNRYLRRIPQKACLWLQRLLPVNRTSKNPDITFQKGTQWFSITGAFAEYFLKNSRLIKDVFQKSFCCDEMIIQTVMINSPFVDTLPETAFNNDYSNCCRYLDWTRGNPYTFTDSDYDELISAGPSALFARKFDYSKTPALIERLFDLYSEKSGD